MGKISGKWGEDRAADFLAEKGYSIIERNFNCRISEIDLIAKSHACIVFVEVKTRQSTKYASAREHVNRSKQIKVKKAAQIWLSTHITSLQPRFDVIEVYAPYGENTVYPQINHIINAFF